MSNESLTGEDRCWPCAVANSAVGLLVAVVPLAAALVRGDAALVAASAVWGAVVIGYTAYRLARRGYLPLAEPVAKATGLHGRIGPGSRSDPERKDGR